VGTVPILFLPPLHQLEAALAAPVLQTVHYAMALLAALAEVVQHTMEVLFNVLVALELLDKATLEAHL
jgi:hypothetical protein